MGCHQPVQKLEGITPIISALQEKKSIGHFMGFRQLVQKFEWILPIVSTLQYELILKSKND